MPKMRKQVVTVAVNRHHLFCFLTIKIRQGVGKGASWQGRVRVECALRRGDAPAQVYRLRGVTRSFLLKGHNDTTMLS